MKKEKIFFHVGLHKTGTTFLQRNVFPYIKDLDYYGMDYRGFKFGKKINKKTLVSHEQLSGKPQSSNIDNRIEKLDLIKKHYPNASIIVFTRKKGWLKSLYSTYIKSGNTLSYDRWYNEVFNKKYLDQESYVKEIKKRFENVFVESFERFKDNNDDTIKRLCSFMDVKVPEYKKEIVGKKLTKNKLLILRMFNYFPIKPKHIFNRLNWLKYKKRD
jgi:hypothetical protein